MAHRSFATAKWIVDPIVGAGTHTTIAAALTSASSGQTIFIRPGTYTEDLTFKAGVGLSAFTSDARTPNVTIIGKATATFTGICSLSGIQLQTNSDFLLVVSGSNATQIKMVNCQLIASNNTAISFTSSDAGSQIVLSYCFGNILTTGIAFFAMSSAGGLTSYASRFTNSGTSTTASTASAGTIAFEQSEFNFPITTSGTNIIGSLNNQFNTSTGNATALTVGGSGANNSNFDYFASGSASAISVGSSLILSDSIINSTNTNSVTGAGSVTYSPISFQGSSVAINPTTQTPAAIGPRILVSGGCQIISGSGSPNTSVTAPQGSLFLRTDGTTLNDRAFINTNGGTAWTAIVTVA